MRWARHALSQLIARDDSKVLMTRTGAHEALLDVVDRDGDQDDEDWGEAAQDADPMGLALVPSARLALLRLAANADSRVDDSWPVAAKHPPPSPAPGARPPRPPRPGRAPAPAPAPAPAAAPAPARRFRNRSARPACPSRSMPSLRAAPCVCRRWCGAGSWRASTPRHSRSGRPSAAPCLARGKPAPHQGRGALCAAAAAVALALPPTRGRGQGQNRVQGERAARDRRGGASATRARGGAVSTPAASGRVGRGRAPRAAAPDPDPDGGRSGRHQEQQRRRQGRLRGGAPDRCGGALAPHGRQEPGRNGREEARAPGVRGPQLRDGQGTPGHVDRDRVRDQVGQGHARAVDLAGPPRAHQGGVGLEHQPPRQRVD
jgi:hypothetical protein